MTDPKHEVVPAAAMLPATQYLHPLVQQMLEKDPTPEMMGKIMDMQERHQRTLAKDEFDRALVAMKADLPPWIKHDRTVDYTSKAGGHVHYTHTSMAQVADTVQPILTRHGFAMNSVPGQDGAKVRVTVQLKHCRGHQETATLAADPDISGSKNPAQAIASTVTYLTRYLTCSLLGVATSDMEEPDGEKADTPANGSEIDTARNIRAVAALAKAGKAKDAAEDYVGRPAEEWTAADLQKLRDWIKAGPAEGGR